MTIRETLNRIKWRDGRLDEARLSIVDRGATQGLRTLPGRDIAEITSGGLRLDDRDDDGHRTVIPYHRIQRIEIGDETIFERGAGA